jgi:hypothetical protein
VTQRMLPRIARPKTEPTVGAGFSVVNTGHRELDEGSGRRTGAAWESVIERA